MREIRGSVPGEEDEPQFLWSNLDVLEVMEIVGDQTNINGVIEVNAIIEVCRFLEYSKEDTMKIIQKVKYIEKLNRERREAEKAKVKAKTKTKKP